MPLGPHDNPDPPKGSEIKRGTAVWIIEKQNYGSNSFTQGIVRDILTSKDDHPRGIKVRLEDGSVGRVQWLMKNLKYPFNQRYLESSNFLRNVTLEKAVFGGFWFLPNY